MNDEQGTDMSVLPGFTPEQTWVLNTIADKAAQRAIEQFAKRDCVLVCPRMDAVEMVTFGRTERGVVGLDQRMAAVERTLATLRRVTWLAVGALITSIGSLTVGIIVYVSTH